MKRRYHQPATHSVPGYSLNEAARMRASLLAGRRVTGCPRCGGDLRVIGADDHWDWSHLVSCKSCGASVMLELRELAASVSG